MKAALVNSSRSQISVKGYWQDSRKVVADSGRYVLTTYVLTALKHIYLMKMQVLYDTVNNWR